jgi:hypothetical protein
MHPLTEALSDDVAAPRAFLRRSCRINYDDFASSFFRFDVEPPEERCPTCIIDGLGQRRLRQSFDVQVFDDDTVVLRDESTCDNDVAFAALVCNAGMSTGQPPRGLSAPRTTEFALSDASLRTLKAQPRATPGAIIRDAVPVGGGEEMREPEVDSDCASSFLQRLRGHTITDEGHEPMGTLAFQPQCFRCALKRTVQLNLNLAKQWNRDAFAASDEWIALPKIIKQQGLKVPPSTKARVSWSLTRLASTEERRERVVEATEYTTQNHDWYPIEFGAKCAHHRKLRHLVVERDEFVPLLPSVAPFLQRGVIQFASENEPVIEGARLGAGGPQRVAIGPQHDHYFSTPSISGQGAIINRLVRG